MSEADDLALQSRDEILGRLSGIFRQRPKRTQFR